MGEKIASLGWVKLNGYDVEIELNGGVRNTELIIHFQTEKFRVEMSEKEFISHSLASLRAAQRIKKEKEI